MEWCETFLHKTVHQITIFHRKETHEEWRETWRLFWGGSRSTKLCLFPCKAASAGDERYLVCAAGAAALVSSSNRFSLGVLQRVVVHVCVLLCACCIRGCRSQCNGCMSGVTFCCHVRREMRVCHVMLQNAL